MSPLAATGDLAGRGAPRLVEAREGNTALGWLEVLFVVVAFQILLGRDILYDLFIGGGGQIFFERGQARLLGGFNWANLLPLLLVYSGTFFFIAVRRIYLPLLSARHLPLYLFLLIVIASAAWSDSPSTTLRRAMGLLGTTAFGAYVGLAFAPLNAMRLMTIAFAVYCIASLLLATGVPSLGTHTTGPHVGLWNGLSGHKNDFGREVVIAASIFSLYFLSLGGRVIPRLAWLALLALCGVLVLGSWSGNALVGGVSIVVLWVALRFVAGAEHLHVSFVLTTLFIFALAGVGVLFFQDILTLLGKDPTLSGRVGLWQAVVSVGVESAFLGEGYRSFWVGDSAAQVYRLLPEGLDHAGHSHNAFLDLWLETGLAGVLAIALIFVLLSVRGVRAILADATPLNMAPVVFLALVVGFSAGSRVLAEQGSAGWVLLVIAWIWVTVGKLPIGGEPSAPAWTTDAGPAPSPRRLGARHRREPPRLGQRWRRR